MNINITVNIILILSFNIIKMSKNTNKSNNELNKSSSNISDVIDKIKTESQKLFVFPSDIVSMIIDKFTKYFNNDLSNVNISTFVVLYSDTMSVDGHENF